MLAYVPLTIFLQIALLLWLTTIPGSLLLRIAGKWDFSRLERTVIGTAIGFGVTPLLFILMRSVGMWQYTAQIVSVLNVVLFAIAWWRDKQQTLMTSSRKQIVALVTVTLLIALIYNFTGFYLSHGSVLAMRGLFGVDIPFLMGVLPSVQHTGYFSDYHQAGLTYSYHDFTYIVAAIVGDLPPNDNLTLIAHAFPIFGFAIWGLSVYAFAVRSVSKGWRAFLITLGVLLLSSIWGDHLLTGALSPSYLVGLITLFSILLVLEPIVHERCSIWEAPLLLVLLVILIKNKLPIYLVIGGGLGAYSLWQLRHGTHAWMILAPAILSLPFLFLFGSASNPLQPTGDFLIGAPLMGYGNQLAALLGVTPASVDPVIQQLDFEIEDLLILPFTLIHLLRMTLLDGRLLLILFTWLLLRKKIEKAELRWLHIGIVCAVVGLILPILYSPSWYPLAVSFYTPEIGAMIAGAVTLAVLARSWSLLESRVARAATILCIVYGIAGLAIAGSGRIEEKREVIDDFSIEALRWISKHTPTDAVIAYYQGDHNPMDTVNDESFYLISALSERQTISAGAKYGSLLAAVADYDSVKGLHPVREAQRELETRRNDLRAIFESTDAEVVVRAMKKYKCEYVVTYTTTPKREDLFTEVFSTKSLRVLKLRS